MTTEKVMEQKQNNKKKQKGASLVEYALLAALIAVLCIIALRALGNKISAQFCAIASQL